MRSYSRLTITIAISAIFEGKSKLGMAGNSLVRPTRLQPVIRGHVTAAFQPHVLVHPGLVRPAVPVSARPRRVLTAKFDRSKLPNALTFARVGAIPVLAVTGLLPPFNAQHTTTAVIFALASLTDLADGYLARKWQVISAMGIFLDPVADKLIVAVALVLLSAWFPVFPILISSAIILCREIFVSALREWMAIRQKSATVKVSFWGKLKTAIQMISISVLLGVTYLSSWYAKLALCLLALSACLALVSAIQYSAAAVKELSAT